MTSELRVMSLDAGSVRRSPAEVASLVSQHQPDLVAITGAPRYQRWRSKRAKIARQLGLVVATADRVGGMFVATSLRVDIDQTTFHMSSSSAGTSPAVIAVTFDLRGERWRLVLAAAGGAPDFVSDEVPTVIVGGVGGPGGISVDRALTVVSCEPVGEPRPGSPQRPMLAVVRR